MKNIKTFEEFNWSDNYQYVMAAAGLVGFIGNLILPKMMKSYNNNNS